jgi:hypothetical protein
MSQQTKQQTKNAALDVVDTVKRGDAPSNDQVTKVIDKTQQFIEEKKFDPNVAGTPGAKVLTDFQGFLQATEQLLENKNSDETIQSLVQDTKAAAKDLKEEGRKELKDTQGKVDSKGQEIKAKGRQVGQGALSMIKLMLRSGEFRMFANDLVDIMQDLFIANGPAIDKAIDDKMSGKQTSSKKIESGIESEPLLKPSELDSNWEFTSNLSPSYQATLPEETKHELSFKLLHLLRRLNASDDFKTGIRALFDIFDDLKDEFERVKDEAKDKAEDNSNLNKAYDDAKQLVEKFSGRSADYLVDQVQDLVDSLRSNTKLRTWLRDFRSLIQDSLEKPEMLDEYSFTKRTEDLIDSGRDLLNDERIRERFDGVLREARAIGDNIKQDEDIQNVQEKAQAFLENFTYVDAKGQRHFNTDLVSQMRQFVVPLFIAQLDQIPIPTIEGSNEDYDYRIENLSFSGHDIVPEMVEIHARSDLEFNVPKMEADKARTRALLKVAEIKPKMCGINFWFRRKTFPKMEDQGTANVLLEGNGVTLRVVLDLNNSSATPSFKVARVYVDIDKLKIDITQAKHDVLLNMFTGLFSARIKHMVEKTIERKINTIFRKIETGFNDLMARYPPAQLKNIVEEKLSQATGIATDKTQIQS